VLSIALRGERLYFEDTVHLVVGMTVVTEYLSDFVEAHIVFVRKNFRAKNMERVSLRDLLPDLSEASAASCTPALLKPNAWIGQGRRLELRKERATDRR
jgi:hypothetical protein